MNTSKLFVVDDDLFSLNQYQQGFKNLGFEDVELFENGTQCLNNLHKKPAVVFLDHNMEDLNGFEVLKKIKRYDPNIFVVIVSAQEDMKTAIDSLKFGAFDYVIKNGTEINRMKEVLERIKQIQEELKQSNPGFLRKLLSIF